MRLPLCTLSLALAICLPALAQEPAATTQNPPPPGSTPQQQPGSAPKGSTLFGCLSGPDKDGKYLLRSMQHRTGVTVLGPVDLKDGSGSKVKLTGTWEAEEHPQPGKEARRFRVSAVEVMATKCEAPTETTPVSKNKQQKKSSPDASSPK